MFINLKRIMRVTESQILIPRKGLFDLQGFKTKTKRLPALNINKVRSITPDFHQAIFSSTSDVSAIINKTSELKSPKTSEKSVLPIDLSSISSLLKPISSDLFQPINDFNSNFQEIINLEKWFLEALEKNKPDIEPVISLCLQELVNKISVESKSSVRVLILLFNNLKEFWMGRVESVENAAKTRENEINQIALGKLEKIRTEVDFFKKGMNEYLDKFVKSDEKNLLLSRENEILKQIIVRFQQEYKLQPINFSKIFELIIEDLKDYSKRTQRRIINSIIPKYSKSVKIQTQETKILKLVDQEAQCKVRCKDAQVGEVRSFFEVFTQTYAVKKARKIFEIFAQGSVKVLPRVKSIQINQRLSVKRSRFSYLNGEGLLPTNVISHSKENNFLFPPDSNPKENSSQNLNNSFQTPHHRHNSTPQIQSSQKPFHRTYTPHPYKKSSNPHPSLYKTFQKAKDILSICLKTPQKILINESTLSLRTLLKTIESMFYSCIPNLQRNTFKGFLEHVYGRLSNKYSFRRMKERRLHDLISSSLRYKDLLTPKIFLRCIGAGALLGQSNYSIHCLKIILQVLNYLNPHSFSSHFFTYNGRKMCQKNRVLDFVKDVFFRRLDSADYLRVVHQVEFRSEIDRHSTRGPLIELDWTIKYILYTFDTFEKQVLTGVSQVIEAITLNDLSVFPSKAEVLMAIRAIYTDSERIINDASIWKVFPFLNPKVSNRSLISVQLIERFCLFRGIFKVKHIENFKKTEVQQLNELEIDELSFMLDELSDDALQNSLSKEDWQRKLELVKYYKDADFAFSIFKKTLKQLLNLFKSV